MDITLEKIELVKDRTAVSYKEAKEALEAADGSVVDAIISIEEDIDQKIESGVGDKKSCVVGSLKDILAKTNATRIIIRNSEGKVLLNIPVTAGVIGAVVSPMLAIVSSVAAFGSKCVVEIVTETGKVIDISNRVDSTVDKAMEKGNEVYDKVKKSETMEKMVDQAGDIIDKTTDKVMKKVKKGDDFDFADDIAIDLEKVADEDNDEDNGEDNQ